MNAAPVAHPLHHLEAEHAAIEAERALEIGDLEMDMPDPGAGDDGWVLGHVCLRWRHRALLLRSEVALPNAESPDVAQAP